MEDDTIKRVAIVGPECTGKSELAEFLAGHYTTAWVNEYARAYLDNLNRPYVESDLVKIAHGQIRMENEWLPLANRILICDTNLIVIKIWSEYKFNHCDKEIIDLMASRSYALHLLTYIDLPWEDDPQREHPYEREKLWNIYKSEMEKSNTPFITIKGDRKERRATAIKAIDQTLKLY